MLVDKGFEMLQHFMDIFNPTAPANYLISVQQLVSFSQLPQEKISKYPQRTRWSCGHLKNISINALITLVFINGMDHDLNGGTMSRFTSGNPTITGADLFHLEQVVTNEVTMKVTMGQSGDSVSDLSTNQANRVDPLNTNNCPNLPPLPFSIPPGLQPV